MIEFKAGMPVTCIEGKLLHTQKHNLTQGKQYTIHHITDDGYIRLTDFPNISLIVIVLIASLYWIR